MKSPHLICFILLRLTIPTVNFHPNQSELEWLIREQQIQSQQSRKSLMNYAIHHFSNQNPEDLMTKASESETWLNFLVFLWTTNWNFHVFNCLLDKIYNMKTLWWTSCWGFHFFCHWSIKQIRKTCKYNWIRW